LLVLGAADTGVNFASPCKHPKCIKKTINKSGFCQVHGGGGGANGVCVGVEQQHAKQMAEQQAKLKEVETKAAEALSKVEAAAAKALREAEEKAKKEAEEKAKKEAEEKAKKEAEEKAKKEAEEKAKKVPKCPKGHILQQFQVPAIPIILHLLQQSYECDVCECDVYGGSVLHGCRTCDFDICSACVHGQQLIMEYYTRHEPSKATVANATNLMRKYSMAQLSDSLRRKYGMPLVVNAAPPQQSGTPIAVVPQALQYVKEQQIVSVTVPANHPPNQPLLIQIPNGQQMNVMPPPGSEGTTIQVSY
jgi:hypothetical protein